MVTFRIALTLLCLMSLSLVSLIHAQDAPNDYVQAHSAAVAAFSQNYASQRADDCNLVHSTNRPCGENLAMSTGDLSGAEAVKLWVDEKPFYDYGSNSCAEGQVCGHYTQVVWKNSVRIGCAKVRCGNGGTFIGCNYDPPGNYVGQQPY
ncbi:hypothetical protein K2173_007622 [Erythroxylum novogranatense]|uniref:SCP domain-containing protein n=1 Tax=Erythroxylum novogranatense TaxID=1862640 RepID=A0AAV8TRZ0_9ROSI|nr:hypothetical protein K2173_007622 [Erythroxylum novogranatense]